jgi:hypothetical protein
VKVLDTWRRVQVTIDWQQQSFPFSVAATRHNQDPTRLKVRIESQFMALLIAASFYGYHLNAFLPNNIVQNPILSLCRLIQK